MALAQALKNSGILATVFERDSASTSRPQGFQIGLNEDGIHALSTLQLSGLEEFLSINDMNGFSIADKNLDLFLQLKGNPTKRDTALVNRWKLRELLSQDLTIEWNKKFQRYEEFPDRVVAHFEDGSNFSGDLLIGCDGSHSKVRNQRTSQIVYEEIGILNIAGFLPFPSISEIPKLEPLIRNTLLRVLGPNGYSLLALRFKAEDGTSHLLWSISQPSSIHSQNPYPEDAQGILQVAQQEAKMFHPDLLKVVQLTPSANLLFPRQVCSSKKLSDKPLGKTCRVTLLGDAAHAMTTHRGLGANTAFVDAIELAKALTQPNHWIESLAKFESEMILRGFKAVDESLQNTRLIHETSYWKMKIRNAVLTTVGYILWIKSFFF